MCWPVFLTKGISWVKRWIFLFVCVCVCLCVCVCVCVCVFHPEKKGLFPNKEDLDSRSSRPFSSSYKFPQGSVCVSVNHVYFFMLHIWTLREKLVSDPDAIFVSISTAPYYPRGTTLGEVARFLVNMAAPWNHFLAIWQPPCRFLLLFKDNLSCWPYCFMYINIIIIAVLICWCFFLF